MSALVFIGLALFALAGIQWAATVQYNTQVSDGGQQFNESVTITGDAKVLATPVSVLAAQSSTLTVRTDANTGTLTMAGSSHGIITGQRIDLFWTGGQRYGVTAGTVSGTSVPIDLGSGTDLPSTSTVIKVGIPVLVDAGLDGSEVVSMVLSTPTTNAYFVITQNGTDGPAYFVQSGRIASWKTGDTSANPVIADTAITGVWMSHNDTTSAHTDLNASFVTLTD